MDTNTTRQNKIGFDASKLEKDEALFLIKNAKKARRTVRKNIKSGKYSKIPSGIDSFFIGGAA